MVACCVIPALVQRAHWAKICALLQLIQVVLQPALTWRARARAVLCPLPDQPRAEVRPVAVLVQ